jgi:hypothetical protein
MIVGVSRRPLRVSVAAPAPPAGFLSAATGSPACGAVPSEGLLLHDDEDDDEDEDEDDDVSVLLGIWFGGPASARALPCAAATGGEDDDNDAGGDDADGAEAADGWYFD